MELNSFPTRRSSDLRCPGLRHVAAPHTRDGVPQPAGPALPALPRPPDPALGRVRRRAVAAGPGRSEEHTSELQSRENLVCRLLLVRKKLTYSSSRGL